MEIKDAILQSEKEQTKDFLASFGLKYSFDKDKTFNLFIDEHIVGTISIKGYIIEDLAVDPFFQSLNIASKLVNVALNYFHEQLIDSYLVFTKPVFLPIFKNMGFRELVNDEKVAMLEGGISSLEEEIKKIKTKVEATIGPIGPSSDIASIIINADPITNGHMYLINEALKNHQFLIIFVVEEDKSFFTFKERYSLVFLATRNLENVVLVPSTKYIVSSLTFPDYFLKDKTEVTKENAKIDAMIFKKYFMKELFIKERYVGSETEPYMMIYNDALKEILQNELVIKKRAEIDGKEISAKDVRSYLLAQKKEEAFKLIPKECELIISSIMDSRNGHS